MTTLHQDSAVQLIELGDIVTSAQSGFASGERDANGVVQLRMNNVTTEGALDWSNVLRVPGTKKQVEKYQLLSGDILFNATNSPNLVGKTAVFKGYQQPIVFSNHLVRLRADSTKVDSNYLGLWFTRQWQLHIFERLCTQWVNQATVRKEDLLLLKVPLPPLPDQRRIAALLDKADRLRRTRRYAAQLSDTFLQSVFVRMFGNVTKNLMGWPVATVEELCSVIIDCPHSTPIYVDGMTQFPCIRTSDIQSGFVDWSTTKYVSESEYVKRIERHIPVVGNILYTREGERYGLAARVPRATTPCLGQRMMLLEANPQVVTSEFLWTLMNSTGVYKQAVDLVGGSTSPHVNVGDIREFKGFIPPLALQQKFARIVQQFEHLCAQQREAERQAEHLFQTLLHRAFSGKV